jgi:hypothetical protein
MTPNELSKILADHNTWLADRTRGARANLQNANLQDANLYDANLQYANLQYANLQNADLQNANLQDANLYDADLQGANLQGTCLDPVNIPYCPREDFQYDADGYAIGYRTEGTPAMCVGAYSVGQKYTANIFSTASTECHPGLYLWPTLEQATAYRKDMHPVEYAQMIKVKTKLEAIHKTGTKYRCKWFEVVERIEQ